MDDKKMGAGSFGNVGRPAEGDKGPDDKGNGTGEKSPKMPPMGKKGFGAD